MSQLDHPHIVPLLAMTRGKDGVPHIIMPVMANGDLLSYLRNGANVGHRARQGRRE